MGNRMRALITGITGQDGSYLAELLLGQGYRVYGLVRQSSSGPNYGNLSVAMNAWNRDDLVLLTGDMTDPDTLRAAVEEADPHEVYNLAAQSFVGDSWKLAAYTMQVNLLGFIHLLEAVRDQDRDDTRVYQASTSEMYGDILSQTRNDDFRLSENTPMVPRSPYGVSKLAAHRTARVYRESYGMYIACGIAFNHESPRRGRMFVTRKIAAAVAEIKAGLRDRLVLGDLAPKRDWGYAGDYVNAMWNMLMPEEPDDYVIATGKAHSVEEFLQAAFAAADMDPDESIAKYVESDAALFRPAEVSVLRGDNSLIKKRINWEPQVDFQMLVQIMVNAELERVGEGVIEKRLYKSE